MKKTILSICTMGIVSILLTGCCLSHEWQEATCTTLQICVKCEKTEGEALGHEWQEATCTEPKTCSVCGETEGEALGHEWKEATWTEAKTCSVCGETEGKALGHKWQEATCTEAKTCSVCGETEGEALGHEWQEANCLNPKTCRICWTTEGNIGDHVWIDATCLAPKTCSICGEIVGEIASHNFKENGICSMCGASREIQLTMDNVDDFLTVTYVVEKDITYYRDDNDRHIEGSGHYRENYDWYTVTVSPISNDYVFKDVQVCIGEDVSGFSDGTHHYDSIYFGKGGIGTSKLYSLSNEGILIVEFEHTKKSSSGPHTSYYRVENIMITDISGTCVRK